MNPKRRSRDEAKEMIEYYIIKNKLEPHSKLPSERAMCNKWGFNRTTLRFAIKRLVIEGKLYQIKGSGTYIKEPKLIRNLQDLKALSEIAKDKGLKLTSKVVSFDIIEGYKEVVQKLHLVLGHKIYVLTRIRYIENEPTAIEMSFLDYERFKGLDKYDFSKASLYSIIEDKYNVTIERGKEKVGISYATDHESQLLNIKKNQGVFYLSGVIYDNYDTPVEYIKSIIRPDKIGFSSILRREKG
ncbi:GntR family transcriptional regulator [Dethiothermospora halolimnae]|uniref:GntR family transcriptional regulator n=1 Tax=Dethiothermospora halolimnae TaxID=3114390 RepID=UPI003CCC03DF